MSERRLSERIKQEQSGNGGGGGYESLEIDVNQRRNLASGPLPEILDDQRLVNHAVLQIRDRAILDANQFQFINRSLFYVNTKKEKLDQKENLNDVPLIKIPVKISTSEKFSVERNMSIPIENPNEESKEEVKEDK